MKLRFPIILSALMMATGHLGSLFGCTAHYVSWESAVRHARVILEMEVITTMDVPAGSDYPSMLSREIGAGSQGWARMRVLRALKGDCSRKEFGVKGGPIASCIMGPQYLTFEKGEKLFLVLDTPLKPQMEDMIITSASRVMRIGEAEMLALMEKARLNWKLAVARHQKAAAGGMERAKTLLIESGGDLMNLQIAGENFEVLSCLRLLINDPDHLPPPIIEEAPVVAMTSGKGAFVNMMKGRGTTCVTSARSALSLPSQWTAVFEKRCKEQPAEVETLNTKLLEALLKTELQVPANQIEALLADPQVQAGLSFPTHDWIWVRGPSRESSNMPLSASVAALLMLAGPEPDYMVHGSFGQQRPRTKLLSEIVLPFLRKQPAAYFEQNRKATRLLLDFQDREIAAMLGGHYQVDRYNADQLFEYFAGLKMLEELRPILDVIESEVDEFLKAAPSASAAGRESVRVGHTERLLRLSKSLADEALMDSDTYRRLRKLSVRLALAN
jgi:hypothetical protein